MDSAGPADCTRLFDGCTRVSYSAPLADPPVALHRYELDPGADLPGGIHAHPDQAELYVALTGPLVVETCTDRLHLDPCGVLQFAPGEFHRGCATPEASATVLAIGVPATASATLVPATCPDCEEPQMTVTTIADDVCFRCGPCGALRGAASCPACDSDAMRFVLDGEPVPACRDCGEQRPEGPFNC